MPVPYSIHRWCCREHNVHQGVSRLFHAFHMWSVWTCSHLCRESGASGGPASSGDLWWMPIELLGCDYIPPSRTLRPLVRNMPMNNLPEVILAVLLLFLLMDQIALLLLGWSHSSRALLVHLPASPLHSWTVQGDSKNSWSWSPCAT